MKKTAPMKLQLKELLKYARFLDFQGKRYNLQWIETKKAKKEIEQILKQPLWKIIPNVIEFSFPPFFITKTSAIFSNTKIDGFLLSKSSEGHLTEKITWEWRNTLDKDLKLFNNVNEALEIISPNIYSNKPELNKFILNI